MKENKFWTTSTCGELSYKDALSVFGERPYTYITRPEWGGFHFIDKNANYCILTKEGEIVINPDVILNVKAKDWMVVCISSEAVDLIEDLLPMSGIFCSKEIIKATERFLKKYCPVDDVPTLDGLIKCFEDAIEYNDLFVAVSVSAYGSEPEIIINTPNNYKSKMEYYKKAYRHDLTLKANENIKILEFAGGDYVENIVCQLTT